jgi:acyl carrier protein
MKADEVKVGVRDFIRTNFLFDDKRVVGDDESLLGSGIVDSTGILELISFLEEKFGLKFKDYELVADNFDSITKIAVFLAGRNGKSKG